MARTLLGLVPLLVMVVGVSTNAAPPARVHDLNVDPRNGSAMLGSPVRTPIIRLGSRIVFVASDGRTGQELWVTDGTDAGTYQLRDTQEGTRSGLGTDAVRVAGDRLFVSGTNWIPSSSIWTTDGTSNGTHRLPGLLHSRGSILGSYSMIASGDRVFFEYYTSALGSELWVADEHGAQLVVDLMPGPGSGVAGSLMIASFGDGRVAYVGTTSGAGAELWVSDGSPTGTSMIADLSTGAASSQLQLFNQSDGFVYFTKSRRLWRSDGTASGTHEVRSTTNQTIQDVMAVVDAGSFALVMTQTELFVVRASDVAATLLSSNPNLTFFVPATQPGVIDGVVVFACDGGRQLWRSDGTAAGTFPLTAAWPSGTSFGSVFQAESFVYVFTTNQGQHDLSRTDGTVNGTSVVGLGAVNEQALYVHGATLGDRLFFVASDATAGRELWVTDGVPGTTRRVVDIHRTLSSSFPIPMFTHGGRTYLRAGDGLGVEPWVLDGTSNEAIRLQDVAPGADSSSVQPIGPIGPDFLFFASRRGLGLEPWLTRGTPESTRLVGDFVPGSAGTSPTSGYFAHSSAQLGDARILAMSDPDHGAEPWRLDGTLAGTYRLADIAPGTQPSFASEFVLGPDQNSVFFVASGAGSSGLWRTDGTSAGTSPAVTDYVGLRVTRPLIVDRDRIIVGAIAATGEFDLYVLDNDRLMRLIDLPSSVAAAECVATLPNGLVLRTEQHTNGDQLWFVDGVSNALTPLLTPAEPIICYDYQQSSSLLYFVVWSSPESAQLWRTDGTPAGTRQVPVPFTGSAPTLFRNLVSLDDGRVAFSATTPESGFELWISDGTGPGTRSLGDIAPAALSSWPEYTHFDGHRVLFSADDHTTTGRELYSWTVVPTCRCDLTADGAISVQDIFTFLAVYFTGRGDFNDSGQTDVDDVFEYLSCWYTGCP